jgi:hypothetical protein
MQKFPTPTGVELCCTNQPTGVQPPSGLVGVNRAGATKLSLGSSAVWTERMLAALERGITGGKWHSLMDKVWEESHLQLAARAVIRRDGCAGVDGVSCQALEQNLGEVTEMLHRQLKEEKYQPKPVKGLDR